MQAVASPRAGLDMVQWLIGKGADVNAVAEDLGGSRPVLSWSASAGDLAKTAALLDAGADIGYRRPSGYDVLIDAMHHRAIARNPQLVPIVQLLIGRGAKLNTV